MESVFFHVDVNNAFLSWEAVHRLSINEDSFDLRTVPSVIGGSEELRHGIVLAKSMPAKEYGIQTGEPLVSARRKCSGLLVVPSNYPIYAQKSKELLQLLAEYSPEVEQFSIDEAFCNMTGTRRLFGEPVTVANRLKTRVFQELGFTVNIGISSNRLLAKIASDFKKPDRVHTLFPSEIPEKLWPLSVSNLLYVGKQTEQKLASMGIHTIGQLARTDQRLLYSALKSHGMTIHEFANGNSTQFDKMRHTNANKGYSNSITLPKDITDSAAAKLILLSLCETVAARIRNDHAFIQVVSVSIVDYNFHNTSKQRILNSPTDVTKQIYDIACILFDELWNHVPIRLLSVSTSKATEYSMQQYSLFENNDNEKLSKLDTAIDSIRKKYGKESVLRASLITPTDTSTESN